ncbi:hypothetical protein SANT12839_019170 [Streptomyces antimycoticus]|uniref:Uncharacterized protein n=1 Tax=Streptomyces antimycoticus TaxID=68175 RepID=A0A4D4JWE5_9ACTN|nr:hypothetical protein SANT12839_019170 [Streptomyces antimycoticus]
MGLVTADVGTDPGPGGATARAGATGPRPRRHYETATCRDAVSSANGAAAAHACGEQEWG